MYLAVGTVHRQRVFLHGDDTRQIPIDAVKMSRIPGKNMLDTYQKSGQSRQTNCLRCGKSPNHDIEVRHAKDTICRKFGKKGPFQHAYSSKKKSCP